MQNQRKKWNFPPNFRNGIIWTAPFPLNIGNSIIWGGAFSKAFRSSEARIRYSDGSYCLNQTSWYTLRMELGSSQWGGVGSPQTATDVVAKQSLGSWSLLWSLNSHSGCVSTSPFGSHAGTHQIRDQSHALEDRNDSNNSLEVYTPNSFIHLYLSQQIDVRSSKTSQCGSANRPSVVPQGSPRIWCLSKSLLVSQIAVSVCRHDLPPCTTKWITLLWVSKRWLEASPWSLYFPTDWDIAHRVQHDLCMHSKSRKNQLPYSWLLTYWE